MAALRDGEPDDAWCGRFDGVVDDIRAAVLCAACDEQCWAQAAGMAGELAGLLFLRGRPMEAQRRYEQAAELTPADADRVRLLRLAAGAAASRFAGNEALRLFRAAADLAASIGDRPGASRDLAMMAMYICRAPGIMSEPHSPAEAAALLAEAQPLSDGSARTEAAVALATAYLEGTRDAGAVGPALRAVELAERAADGVVHSAALDLLCTVRLALRDIPGAVRVVRHRAEVIRALPVGATSGFECGDFHLYASDVDLAAGDLAGARDHADALARLPFYRDENHLAVARRLRVDALSGAFDDVVRNGERFRLAWERAGRSAAPNLGASAYAVAMAHGMLGDEERRSAWLRTTVDIGIPAERLADCATGWAPVFDALLALHRDELVAAVERLSADVDDTGVWRTWGSSLWHPWYAALWAEAAVLAGHPDAAGRIARSRYAARDNPIATAIVERADALAARDHDRLVRFAITFAQLGCPYQQARTGKLAAAVR
jgi:hypothetical protein